MANVNTVVKGKNIDITPALRTHAEKKVAKFGRFMPDDRNVMAELTLRVERNVHIAELTIDLKGIVLRGEGRTNDMYISIDEAVDKMERQFEKYKTRIQRKLQGPKISELPGQTQEPIETETSLKDKIVRIKRFAFKPMDAEEAIMQMELLGHSFFVFTNAADDEINVVYKRRDGNYGLIEQEY